MKTSRVFIRDCSMVSVYPLVLFGGGQVSVELHRAAFVISLDDGWIQFAAASHQVKHSRHARALLSGRLIKYACLTSGLLNFTSCKVPFIRPKVCERVSK